MKEQIWNLAKSFDTLKGRPFIRRIIGDTISRYVHSYSIAQLKAKAVFYVVLPGPPSHSGHKRPLSGCARQLIRSIRMMASSVWGGNVGMLTIDPKSGEIMMFGEDNTTDPAVLFQGKDVIFLANPSFLLLPEHPIDEMVSAAQNHTIAVRSKHFGESMYAVSVKHSTVNHPLLNEAISSLSAYENAAAGMGSSWHDSVTPVYGEYSGEHEFSPSVEGVRSLNGKRTSDCPCYLNMAILELLYSPIDFSEIQGSPERMRHALFAQRESSHVPWIFNMLINEIEYRMAATTLISFPPEIHLSLTGKCNIECRFCSYSHENARGDDVGLDEMNKLDFIRYLHTVRLSSGLGEPTINPGFGAIIELLATKFPHLDINFSTNGIALNNNGLTNRLINKVSYVNVSLNAATRNTWRQLCQRDLFDHVCANLRRLKIAKGNAGSLLPLVYGSMVLTKENIQELPDMPGLCRSLGIDRFTGIPFLSFNYSGSEKYGVSDTFHQSCSEYELIYHRTLQEARRHRVSIEIPVPPSRKRIDFGLEVRAFHDFARIEEPAPRLDPLVDGLEYKATDHKACPELWKIAYIANTRMDSLNRSATHYLYPCLSALSTVDFSVKTPFSFTDPCGFLQLWNSMLYKGLRKAQIVRDVSTVCDVCRKMDSRDPANFGRLNDILDEWKFRWGTESTDH